jgi:hypothetical protein
VADCLAEQVIAFGSQDATFEVNDQEKWWVSDRFVESDGNFENLLLAAILTTPFWE